MPCFWKIRLTDARLMLCRSARLRTVQRRLGSLSSINILKREGRWCGRPLAAIRVYKKRQNLVHCDLLLRHGGKRQAVERDTWSRYRSLNGAFICTMRSRRPLRAARRARKGGGLGGSAGSAQGQEDQEEGRKDGPRSSSIRVTALSTWGRRGSPMKHVQLPHSHYAAKWPADSTRTTQEVTNMGLAYHVLPECDEKGQKLLEILQCFHGYLIKYMGMILMGPVSYT